MAIHGVGWEYADLSSCTLSSSDLLIAPPSFLLQVALLCLTGKFLFMMLPFPAGTKLEEVDGLLT